MPEPTTKSDLRLLARLVCGAPPLDDRGGNLSGVLGHLSTTLHSLSIEIEGTIGTTDPQPRIALIAPFLGRSLLEVALTALLGRLDPFRVLVIREAQMRKEFKHDSRSKASIQWTGDICQDEKPNENDMWNAPTAAMNRALLGMYYDHVFWRKAFAQLLDSVPDRRGGDWMRDLRRVEPGEFTRQMRSRAMGLYSWCSKGIHHEFVIPPDRYYASEDLSDQLKSGIEIIAKLALAANAGTDILFPLTLNESLECFERIQD